MEIAELLKLTVDRDASDLHIAVGRPPVLRVDGRLLNVEGPPLSAADTRRLIYGVLTDLQKQKFEEIEGTRLLAQHLAHQPLPRQRPLPARQRRGGVPRHHLDASANFEELHLPVKVCERLARRPSRPGAHHRPHRHRARSTTLAAIVDLINNERDCHIITIEDPIEYLHSAQAVHWSSSARCTRTRMSLLQRAQVRAAPGPRRDHGRRNARPRDHRARP